MPEHQRPSARRSSPSSADQRQRQERRQHEQIAVGEVDQLEDAVDHRVAQRDQREHHAVGEADHELLQTTVFHGVAARGSDAYAVRR